MPGGTGLPLNGRDDDPATLPGRPHPPRPARLRPMATYVTSAGPHTAHPVSAITKYPAGDSFRVCVTKTLYRPMFAFEPLA